MTEDEMNKEEKKAKRHLKLFDRFSKAIVIFCLIYGLILTTLSYYFAYKGFEPLVDLSTVVINTIVNPVLLWLTQNAICNIFEYNKLIFSTPLSFLKETQNSEEICSESKDEKEMTNEQDT